MRVEQNLTYQEFLNHADPLIITVSVDAKTNEHSYDIEKYEPSKDTWLKKVVKEDFPERFVFTQINEAACRARTDAICGEI